MRVFVTDCEGPITRNDNAFELCCHFIPQGESLFKTLSRYDDYLAYVERRAGYRAGNTLKLILPFLLAFGVDSERMFPFSLDHLDLMPRALEVLRFIKGLMPVFVVSTSYEPYLKALSGLIPLPMDCIFCTSLRLEGLKMDPEEAERLKGLAREIASFPPFEDWQSLEFQRALKRLDEIFFGESALEVLGRIMDRVEPVGGEAKARALREIMRRVGVGPEDLMYVGDSITDREALREVRLGGGLSVAFNPNRYALEEAEVVCLSEDVSPLAVLAYLFFRGGREEVLKAVLNWNEDYLRMRGVPEEWLSEGSEVGILSSETLSLWVERSEGMRKAVRGKKVGELG